MIRLAVIAVRRFLTWGLVAAVAALGLAAGIDALRGGGEPEGAAVTELNPEPPVATAPAEQPEDVLVDARADLQAAGVPEGRLTYANEDCRNYVMTLPDLGPGGPPPGYFGLCRYVGVVGGQVETVGSSRSPDWELRVECKGGWLTLLRDIFDNPKPELQARARGCDPAWKPDGTITFIRHGEVRRFARCPGDTRLTIPVRCSKPVLSRAELDRQLRGARWRGSELRIEELHWLTDARFAAILQARSADDREEYLALFERGRIVREPSFAYADLGGIRPSPTGRLVAAYVRGRGGGIVVVDREGEPVHLAMAHGHGIAWSPDERWIAEATEDAIYVFRADEESPEFIRIPITVARDVLWEDLP